MPDSRAVLLVMDFQQGVVKRLGDESVLDAARRAVDAARRHRIPVMFVRVGFRPGYPEVSGTNRTFDAVRRSGDAMTQDHPATQVHAALEPRRQRAGTRPPASPTSSVSRSTSANVLPMTVVRFR